MVHCSWNPARRAVCRAQCLERGPPYTTGGTSYFSRGVRRRDKRQIATGQPNRQLSLKILQWNAEGISKKKDALLNRLSEHKIDMACIQETHLSEKYRFTMRGYQCMRMDRAEGTKGRCHNCGLKLHPGDGNHQGHQWKCGDSRHSPFP